MISHAKIWAVSKRKNKKYEGLEIEIDLAFSRYQVKEDLYKMKSDV